jgi:hypothetical protein
VPINLEAEDAAQIADKMHKVAWAEQQGTTKFSVSEKFAYLVPSDVILVEASSGALKRVRIQKTSFVDSVIQIEAVIDRAAAYSSASTAPTPVDPTQPESNVVGATTYEVMDLPALAQSHDTLHVYVAAHGAGDLWNGAVVEQQLDTEWVERGTISYPATMGYSLEALPSHARGLDTTNSILVSTSDDDIATITQAEFDAGGNLALIGDELINFRDVTAEDNNYRLSCLNRGALDTDIETSVAAGARFVKLDSPLAVPIPSSLIGEDVTLRCYSIGLTPTVANETTFEFAGNSQIEWAVSIPTIELTGGDWVLDWAHTKRIGAPNSAVISQHFLNFYIDFTKSGGSVVTRTVNESLTYTEAEQIADFGAAVTSWDSVYIYGENRYTGIGKQAIPYDITGTTNVINGVDNVVNGSDNVVST